MKINVNIDLSGLRCPLPVLRVKKALSDMIAGEVLQAFANDSGAKEDIPAFIAQAGHDIQIKSGDGGHYFIITKK